MPQNDPLFGDISKYDGKSLLSLKFLGDTTSGRVAGVTHSNSVNQVSAAKHGYEGDHFFESTKQETNELEYIKVGGLHEDASIFWERINMGFFDNNIDQSHIKMLRNFYKLTPE